MGDLNGKEVSVGGRTVVVEGRQCLRLKEVNPDTPYCFSLRRTEKDNYMPIDDCFFGPSLHWGKEEFSLYDVVLGRDLEGSLNGTVTRIRKAGAWTIPKDVTFSIRDYSLADPLPYSFRRM